MTPSPPSTPPPDIQSAEAHLTQVLSLGEAQPYVIKIILAHLDDPHPDPHVIHKTLSPFLSDPTSVVKSLFSHLNIPLCDRRHRTPRTESEERHRQYRRERRRERRRLKEEYYRSRKRRRRDYEDYSPGPESERPSRRRRTSASRHRDRSPTDRSPHYSPENHIFDRSPRSPIRDPSSRDRIPDRSSRYRVRDRSPNNHVRDHSPNHHVRDRSPNHHVRDRSPNHHVRDPSPRGRARDLLPEHRPRHRSPRRERPRADLSHRPWESPGRPRDALSSPRTRDGPASPLHEGGGRETKLHGTLRVSSPLRQRNNRRKQNGTDMRTNAHIDPGSSLDSKAAPKHSNKLRHLRSKVLASLSKPAEDGDAN